MHKRLAHLAASLTLCGVFTPLYAGTAEESPVSFASPSVKARTFRIIGSRAFSEAELLKLVNHAIGKELSSADLNELANRITAHYRSHGFQRAHATLPRQNFGQGIIRFIVSKSAPPIANSFPAESRPIEPSPRTADSIQSPPHSSVIKASGFRILGSKIFSEADLLPLVTDAIGKSLTADDLNNLAQRITEHYRQHGYKRARAVVDPNIAGTSATRITEGIIRFLITKLPPGAPLKQVQDSTPTFLSAPDTIPGGGNPVQVLLNRANWWVNRDRDDLAQETLNKLFNIEPNQPDGLAALAEIQIKLKKISSAQTTLNALKQTRPNHPAIPRIETLLRVNGRDKLKLRHALQLAHGRASDTEKALAAFREIFPDGPPDGDLALEYWKLVADTRNGWKPAYEGLSRLVREYPDNQRYRLRLAEHEAYRYPGHYPVDRKSLRTIIEIAKVPSVKVPEFEKPAKEVWSYTLMRRSPSPADIPLLKDYLAFDPNNEAIKGRLRSINQDLEVHRRLLADPDYKAGVEGVALLNKGQLDAAAPLLEQAVKARPRDADLTGELGLLRLRQGQHAQAQALFDQALRLTHGTGNEWKSLIKTSQFWKLMHEAREARTAKDFELAENKLNAALQADPNVADAYSLMADVQLDRGQVSASSASYRHALSIDPLNSDALEGLIAINRRQSMTQAQHFIAQLTPAQHKVLSQTINNMEIEVTEAQAADSDDFLSALERIPAEERPENISRLWGDNLEKLVYAHAQSGRKDEALKLLQDAEPLAADDEVASLAVASAWGKLGEYGHADALFDKLKAAHTPPSNRWYIRHVDYLALKSAPELGTELATLATMPNLTPAETQTLLARQEALAVSTASAQLDAGKPALSHQTLAPFLKASPDRTSLLLADARAYQAEKDWPSAQAAYTRVLQLEPSETEAIRGLIGAQIAMGDRAAALAQLDEWAADTAQLRAYTGSQMIDFYLALDEPGRAQKQLDILLAKYPNDTQVLNQAWQMAQREQNLDSEVVYLQKALAAEKAELATPPAQTPDTPAAAQMGYEELGSPHKIQRDWKEKKLAALIDERSDWLSSSVDIRSHSGTPGLSQSNFTEIPVEYKRPWHAKDELFVRTDWVKLDAGTTDPSVTTFGRMLFCQQPYAACSAALLAQHAEGKSLTAGYISSDLKADIGVTPMEFAVTNIVGGVRYSGDYKQLGYSLEASRRPVTDSLLSYAGTRDPATGQIWGGVVSTGARFGLSLDEGKAFGFWSSAGLHILTGNNVQTNRQFQLMTGGQWRVINEDNRLFSVGLTGMYWLDSKDAGEYTFGHGGYYSPQNYRSLSVPVTYGARSPRFSYVVRGAVSVTQSQTRSADYFPTDSLLQAEAKALTATNFITPAYSSSGASTSTGYSLEGIGEYQLNQKLFVGGMLSIARSVNYTPNHVLFYLRYSLDHAAAQPVYFQPKPVEPTSRF